MSSPTRRHHTVVGWLCPLRCHRRGSSRVGGWLRARSSAGAPGTAATSTQCRQNGEERLLLPLPGSCPVAGPGLDLVFSAHHVSAALLLRFITRRINNPARWAEGMDAKSLHGCLPPMNGHNPLNNERLLCLCLLFWQACSFQVLLITALLATLRLSIAGRPS